ncbi:conserved hypothetical protein [Leishmania braziliensis MHOM/BR/75/M2904]|uniref:Uncharacterized protein n=1 Tax=Leishmania braziliensis TaxID=5660 RepID=A4H5H6_LEIBR|nr:conserved hypothetical protein [Leishmania braziliensis MHOM/BR/75/M2904]CAJ2467335.1 unnamed protein product [Leishmania braziliensis]CAJ2467947.1 unnamed protein product [Leishmania braziliensis]CAM41740.1 conserved hypothetical protein [Leishmania braziliensis MHOM/BR/75/M2904]
MVVLNLVLLLTVMERESAASTGSGVSNREGVLEKMLEEEMTKRREAERTIEELQKQVQLLEKEVLRLRHVYKSKKDSASITTMDPQDTTLLPACNITCTENSQAALHAENDRLRQFVRRQSALIDVLRRQKVLLEASASITISARDFNKQLELHKV